MYMQLSIDKLKQLRDSKAWSQSHLAEVADLSLRTIQRVEKSGLASPESTKAICCAYDIQVSELLQQSVDESNNVNVASVIRRPKLTRKTVTTTLVAFAIAFIISFALNH